RLLPARDGRTPFEGAPQRRAGSHVAPVVDRARHTLARASGAACARRRARRGLARPGPLSAAWRPGEATGRGSLAARVAAVGGQGGDWLVAGGLPCCRAGAPGGVGIAAPRP